MIKANSVQLDFPFGTEFGNNNDSSMHCTVCISKVMAYYLVRCEENQLDVMRKIVKKEIGKISPGKILCGPNSIIIKFRLGALLPRCLSVCLSVGQSSKNYKKNYKTLQNIRKR